MDSRNGHKYSNTLTDHFYKQNTSDYVKSSPETYRNIRPDKNVDTDKSAPELEQTSTMPTAYKPKPQIKTYKSSPSKTFQKNYLPSSYAPAHLKSFMSTSFSSDEEKEETTSTTAIATTSFFSSNKLETWTNSNKFPSSPPSHNEIKTESEEDHTFPTFKSKRKRSYSSSSSESISKKSFSFNSPPTNNRKGPIAGTYGRSSLGPRTVYKPRFPSDDSVKSKSENNDSDSNQQLCKSECKSESLQSESKPQSPLSAAGIVRMYFTCS